MTKTVDIAQSDGLLKELVSLVRSGTEVLLTEGDRPLARLVPMPETTKKRRIAGLHAGAAWMSDDFDAPLPEDFWTGTA